MPAAPASPLHESLLHAAPVRSERAPGRRWAYPLWSLLLTSVFVLYHAAVLLVWNGPGQDLAKPFQASFLAGVHGHAYFFATRNDQSWAMFAPNPDRTNNFIKVFVIDQRGEIWDFGQDIWAEDRYPYLFYDRRGKVNRNIDGKKHLQRIYGAWVCREWERQHQGERARAVRFVKWWTQVPEPELVLQNRGWDAWAAPYKEFVQETITCEAVAHGTLPNHLRARYKLAPIDEAAEFTPVEIPTWVER
ncbi:MAG: hypothetical protein R6X02_00040 [Enhygromyxa sp.]